MPPDAPTSSTPLRDPADPATWALATHEAGHVVAFHIGRIQYRSVGLRSPWPGQDAAVLGHPGPARARPLWFIVGALAGPFAEAHATGRDIHEVFSECGEIDLDHADSVAATLHPDAAATLVRRAWQLAVRHQHTIATVATALVHHSRQRLTEAEVATIIRDTETPSVGPAARDAPGPTTTNADPWSPATTETVKLL